jgi:hypothetical protein
MTAPASSSPAPGPAKMTIGLLGDAAAPARQPLFDSLRQLFPVHFQTGPARSGEQWDAAIIFSRNAEDGAALIPKGLPVYLAVEDPARVAPSASHEIHFAPASSLGDQVMEDRDLKAFAPLTLTGGDELLASRENQPLWMRRPTPHGGIDLVAVQPPTFGAGNYLCEDFTAGRFMRLLPLLAFLRRVTAASDWQNPVQQACFVFDDPCLHWPTYGYLDFRRLAAHARTHDYYAAVATVPLDAWWLNSSALKVFAENAPRLSLLMHGNDHIKNELGEPRSQNNSIDILAQALRRLARLERHHGLEISRIMEAPNAALAESVLRGMSELDFEGTLATPELLLRFNPKTVWPATLGLEQANFLGGGLPAIPRIKMTRDWKTSVRLTAWMNQPIVLVGHHEDAAGGLELLAEYAHLVNGLGKVKWASPRGILRSSYRQLRQGRELHVRMFSRRISLAVPEGVETIWIHRPWIGEGGGGEILNLRCAGKQDGASGLDQPVVGPIAVQSSETLEIASLLKNPVDYRIVGTPSLRVWSVVRKILMEIRDRTRPLMPRQAAPGAGFDSYEKSSAQK